MATAKKGSGRKYGATASKSVEREMKALKQGKLKSGSGQKVTNPRQAIAMGLSEARRAGGKVPPAPKKAARKTATAPAKKVAGKKAAAKKAATRKTAATKTATKKTAARKTVAKKSAAGKSAAKKSASKKAAGQ